MKYVFIFIMTMMLGFGPALAQLTDNEVLNRVPHHADELSEADFLKGTTVVTQEPLGDKYLAFEVRLPLKWTKSQDMERGIVAKDNKSSQGSRILGEISKFYGPTRPDAGDFFMVEAMTLDYEMSVRNWFLNYIYSRGYSLQGLEVIDDSTVEAVYVTLKGDNAFLYRVRAIANGPRVVVVSYAVPEQYADKERGMQERVLSSFRFISPEDVVKDHVRTHQFLDILKFNYPSTWRVIAPNVYSMEGMDAKVLNSVDSKTVSGEIDVRVISTELDTSLAEEVKYLKEDIQERGLSIDDMIEVGSDFKFGDYVLYNRVEIYVAKDKNRKIVDHEFWLAVVVEDSYYYIVTLLTPSRMSDFYTWAKNNEAFKLVVQSLGPYEGTGEIVQGEQHQ